MSKQRDGQDKRKHERFTVEGIEGTMVRASEVNIINMSLGGAKIEATRRLNIGRDYTLKIEQADKSLSVIGKVVWSSLKRFKKDTEGQTVPCYQAGLQFTNIFSERSLQLFDFISHSSAESEKRLSGLRFAIKTSDPAILDHSLKYSVKKISMGGMLIETTQEFDIEEDFPMELFLGEEKLAFNGQVRSCLTLLTGDETRYDVGIAFLDLSEENKTKLSEFIATL